MTLVKAIELVDLFTKERPPTFDPDFIDALKIVTEAARREHEHRYYETPRDRILVPGA